MRPAERIKNLFNQSEIGVSPEVNDRLLNDTMAAFEKSKSAEPTKLRPSAWRIIMKSRTRKLIAAAVVIIAAVVGSDYLVSQNRALAGVVDNAQKKPWIHMVTSKGVGDNKRQIETWISLESKVVAKTFDDKRATFASGTEQKEYLYDPLQNKIFVSEVNSRLLGYGSATDLMQRALHLVSQADKTITEDKVIDGVETEIIRAEVTDGTKNVNVTLQRDVERNLLTHMEVIFPDPFKNITARYDYPESGPRSIYELGALADTDVVQLTTPPELKELREEIDSRRNADVKPYVAVAVPWNGKQLPTTFTGDRGAVIRIWNNNTSWRCDMGYYGEDTTLTHESVADDVPYAVQSLIPVRSDIVTGGRIYSLVRKEAGDGKLHSRLGCSYPQNTCIEEICWPRMTGTVGVPVRWKIEDITGPNGESLIMVERSQDGRIPVNRLHVMPQRDRWFFNPERDYICQKQEHSIFLHADWVINKHWLEGEEAPRSEWANRDYENTVEVLEYGQTSSGRWYPRMVKGTFIWYDDDMQAAVDPRSSYSICRRIYIDENVEVSGAIFDPEKLDE